MISDNMEKTDLYETIFKRKSIRKYALSPLPEKTMQEISNYLKNLRPLHEDIKVEFKILRPEMVKRRMMKKAPHYLAAFSETKEGYLSNIGFMLQQMDLFFSANGLGSCWQGIPTLKKEVLESTDLKFIILMAFGNPQEPLHRNNISEFKRKSLHDISDISGLNELLEAARIAPSATNAQPWFFTGNENNIHAYAIKPNLVKGFLTKKYPPIDVGISLYHLKLAAKHLNKENEFLFKSQPKKIKDHEYIATLRLK